MQCLCQSLLGQREFPDKLDYCRSLGAVGGALRGESMAAQLQEQGPFDVILDPVGASYAPLNLRLLGEDGRWVSIGLMGGRMAELDMGLLLGKRVQLIGSTLRNRDAAFKRELLADLQREVWPLLASGRLQPQLSGTFPREQAEQAFASLASNQVVGKLALRIANGM